MDWFIWTLLAILGIALILGGGIAFAASRRRQLPPSERSDQLEGPDGELIELEFDDEDIQAGPEAPVAEPEAAPEPPAAEPAAEPEPAGLEVPEAPTTRMGRLRRRLASSNNTLARALADLLSVDRIDEDTWDDFEATLIASDLGVGPTTELVEALRKELSIEGTADGAAARTALRRELVRLVDPTLDRGLNLDTAEGDPAVIMVVGVNGTGKTTTCGKLARVLVAEDKTVLLGAADTFRAAAAEQLTTWGERVGVETVRGPEGGDPASVAFDAVDRGVASGTDVVIIDTAGRLHTKVGLMDQLGKVKRVVEKKSSVDEVLLVLDATTGQNGLTQARIFSEVVDVTGVVLTKLDGTAKGGIVVQVQRELGVPVKLIGLGEGVDDLAPFDPEGFVAGILGE